MAGVVLSPSALAGIGDFERVFGLFGGFSSTAFPSDFAGEGWDFLGVAGGASSGRFFDLVVDAGVISTLGARTGVTGAEDDERRLLDRDEADRDEVELCDLLLRLVSILEEDADRELPSGGEDSTVLLITAGTNWSAYTCRTNLIVSRIRSSLDFLSINDLFATDSRVGGITWEAIL